VTYFPPAQGPGRPFGEPTPRITEQELREDAEMHDREERQGKKVSWWRRLFRRRPAAK
jgi:hypothetical protein